MASRGNTSSPGSTTPPHRNHLDTLNVQEKDLHFPFGIKERDLNECKRVGSVSNTMTKLSDIEVQGYVQSFTRNNGKLPYSARRQLEEQERCDRGGFLAIGRKHNQNDYKFVDAHTSARLYDMVFTCDGFIGCVVHTETRLFRWVMCVAQDASYVPWVHVDNMPPRDRVMVRPYKETELIALSPEWVHNAMYHTGILDSNNVWNLVNLYLQSPTYQTVIECLKAKQPASNERKRDRKSSNKEQDQNNGDNDSDDVGRKKGQKKLNNISMTKKKKQESKPQENGHASDEDAQNEETAEAEFDG